MPLIPGEAPQIYSPFWAQVNHTDVVAFSAAVVSDKVSAKRGISLTLFAASGAVEDVQSVLSSDAYLDVVRADEMSAREIGATGVPFFVFNERVGLFGAQPPEVLVQAMMRASDMSGSEV